MHCAHLHFIGLVSTQFKELPQCPRQGQEGGVQAFLHIYPEFLDGLLGIEPGIRIILLTWLDRANRSVLQVYPRGDRNNPLSGVFLTRSPARPNPIGYHEVRVIEVHEDGITVEPLEVLDNTPLIDIKIGSVPNKS